MSATQPLPSIPLSPNSPPETGVKRRRPSKPSPKLPLSPRSMSVATKSYVSYGSHTSHVDEAASRSSPRSPSSATSTTRTSTQRNSQPYATPLSNYSDATSSNMNDPDHHRDKRQRIGDGMDLDGSMLPTNHERQFTQGVKDPPIPMEEDVAMQDSTSDPILDELETDMGKPFLLCRSKVEPQKPDVQRHLLSMYGLGRLQQSVARLDPSTGEKINKLRKSYEGQIKDFQLSGRNRAVKLRDVKPNGPTMRESIGSFTKEIRGTYLETDAEWSNQRAHHKIQMTDDFKAKVRRAMQMQPGKVRHEAKWDDILGHEKKAPAQQPMATSQPVVQRPNGMMRHPANAVDLKRHTRGKKRSYSDESFIGYGEGFSEPEDNRDPDGEYGSDDGNRKKRRKNDGLLLGR